MGPFFLILMIVLASGCAQTKPTDSQALKPSAASALIDKQREQAKNAKSRVKASVHTVVHRLTKQLGKPYVRGGVSPKRGFDCSGLVYYAYNKVLNRKLPRTTHAMFRDKGLKRIDIANLRRGDLVFFRSKSRGPADHVGVYLGDDTFIEAPRTGLNIRISNFLADYWQDHYLGARRILTNEAIQ
ncbi:C40 family peptidase [Kosakonia calanthes]|uniref:C40 family peptidase n=1 Tax=Kosakonia calanthes TaxID=3139408 RepID=UPI003CC7E0C6